MEMEPPEQKLVHCLHVVSSHYDTVSSTLMYQR